MSLLRKSLPLVRRAFTAAATPAGGKKVAVLGAAGGIGQPLGLLMKLNPMVSELALYDIAGTPGVAADISHVNTPAKTTGYVGADELEGALTGCDIVIIPAGVPRKPGMTRDDLFNINASIVQGLTEGIAKFCPQAMVAMISNPVNSTVPIAAEVFKRAGTWDPKRLFGVTTLDIVRARTFYAEKTGQDVKEVDVPVVGGHAGVTIVPLFSQASPFKEVSPEVLDALTKRTQDGGTEVVAAKAGKGSATLSMAYAGALFAEALLKGMTGTPVTECTYVASSVTEAPFFASKVTLGPSGAETVHDLGKLTPYEEEAIKLALPELLASIDKGVKFVTG